MTKIIAVSRSQREVAIKLIAPCYEMNLLCNAETWMNIREDDLKKLEMNQYDI